MSNKEYMKHRCQYYGCGRIFDKAQQLRMHVVRVHTGNYAFKNMTKEQRREKILAQKRATNQKMRARYLEQGLTSAGKPRKRPYQPRPPLKPKRLHYVYPVPAEKTIVVSQHEVAILKYCPQCGEHLEKWQKKIESL